MTTREYYKAEWQKLKGQPLKAKLEHIFTYYRYHIIAVVVVVALVVSMVVSIAGKKEYAFQAYLIGAAGTMETADTFLEDFAQVAGIDTQAYNLAISPAGPVSEDGMDENSVVVAQTVAVRVAAQELDVMGAPQNQFMIYAYQDYFLDLSKLFPAEQLESWGGKLIYMDRALLAQEDRAELPDPYAPETMKEPVAVGLHISASSVLAQYCSLPKDGLILGILINGPHRDAAVQFLQLCGKDMK